MEQLNWAELRTMSGGHTWNIWRKKWVLINNWGKIPLLQESIASILRRRMGLVTAFLPFLLFNWFCSSNLPYVMRLLQCHLWSPVQMHSSFVLGIDSKRFKGLIIWELREVWCKSHHLKSHVGVDQLCLLDAIDMVFFFYKFSFYVYNEQISLKSGTQRKVFFLPKWKSF